MATIDIKASYTTKLKALIISRYGSEEWYVEPTDENEALYASNLLRKNSVDLNKLVNKPVDSSKSAVVSYYIGLAFHKRKMDKDSEAWLTSSYSKECNKALFFVTSKYEEDVDKKSEWIQYGLLCYKRWKDAEYTVNMLPLLFHIMFHTIEDGEAEELIPQFIDLCYDSNNLGQLMMLSYIKTSNLTLTDAVKVLIRSCLDKFLQKEVAEGVLIEEICPEVCSTTDTNIILPQGTSAGDSAGDNASAGDSASSAGDSASASSAGDSATSVSANASDSASASSASDSASASSAGDSDSASAGDSDGIEDISIMAGEIKRIYKHLGL